MLQLQVNGEERVVGDDVDPGTPLLWVLRDHLGLIGAKYGCGVGACGACTVHLDGKAVRSCQTPVSQVGGRKVTTIEGLAQNGKLHPLQQAGQIMNAAAMLADKPKPTDADIHTAMTGNMCRCACYTRIRTAIHLAANGGSTNAG